MRLKARHIIIAISISIVFTLTQQICPAQLNAADSGRIRAKIGIQIQSGQKISRAKSRERLKAGDAVRLYVHSESNCYVYIIHTDGKNVNLLNITEQKIQSSTLILPSAQAFYEIDGQSNMEKFTIICSPEQIPEMSGLEKKSIIFSEWTTLENRFHNSSNALLSEDDEPFPIYGNMTSIAGNVRGITNSIRNSSGANDDPFLKELQIFSGKGLVIKTYEFQIRK